MAGSKDRLKGSVKWFDSFKGFGFITPEGGGEDLFVRQSSIMAVDFRSLTAGETVEFVVSVNDDGRSSAVSVTAFGDACIPVIGYFRGACLCCNELCHFLCNGIARGFDFYHSGGKIDTFTRAFPAIQPTNLLNPLKPVSFSPLTDKSETLEGHISEGMHAEEEEEDEVNEEDEGEEEDEEQSEVNSEDNEPKRRAKWRNWERRAKWRNWERRAKWRNWAELPQDILFLIFKKITASEILLSAQSVCRTWRQLSHEPALWRRIDLGMYDPSVDMLPMAIMAVDRSEGCVEELYMKKFPTDEFMLYIAERATRLRSLHLISVLICEETLVETLGKLPLLEELEISLCYFSDYVLEEVGPACPQLKGLRFNDREYHLQLFAPIDSTGNDEAFAIAKHFKQLRRLQLFANQLTSIGLLAILDNCPDLEYLDIRQCFNVGLFDESLKKKCARIKDLKLPNDSLAGYEYRVEDRASGFND